MLINHKANAKINLDLKIVGKCEDSEFHLIDSTMALIDMVSFITIDIEKANSFCSSVVIMDYENQEWFSPIIKMVELWSKERQFPVDVKIKITHPIPPFSGLGGMSSYTARVLEALEYFFYKDNAEEHTLLSVKRKNELALMCGCDVPFFASNCLKAHVSGKGEIITPQKGESKKVILHFPDYNISTKYAYEQLDKQKIDNFLDLKENKLYYNYLVRETGISDWKLSGSGSTFFLYDVDDSIISASAEWTKKRIYGTLYNTLN